jgi:hypothetical protein
MLEQPAVWADTIRQFTRRTFRQTLSGAGHFLMLEQPAAWADTIRQFTAAPFGGH